MTDLSTLIRSKEASGIQLVVNAEDLRKCFESFIAWGIEEQKKRDEPRYYSREEAAEILHVTAPTLLSYRKKGLIPAPVTIEGRVLYDRGEFHEAIRRNRMKFRNYTRIEYKQ